MKYYLLLAILTTCLFANEDSPILKNVPTIRTSTLQQFFYSEELSEWHDYDCPQRNEPNYDACVDQKVTPYITKNTLPLYVKSINSTFNILFYQFDFGPSVMSFRDVYFLRNIGNKIQWFSLLRDGATRSSSVQSRIRSVRQLPYKRLWVEIETTITEGYGDPNIRTNLTWRGFVFGIDENDKLKALAWDIPILSHITVETENSSTTLPKTQIDVSVNETNIQITQRTPELSEEQRKFIGTFPIE